MIFDRTCHGPALLPGLSHVWGAGQHLYRALGRLDASHGASSWQEALDWLASHEAPAPIAEIQLWGHGRWGNARMGGEVLDARSLATGHPHRVALDRLRSRLLPAGQSLWWFRTCETFGTRTGQSFARSFSDLLGCRAAGHTYVIGWWQSGLHSLPPGATPTWSPEEGLPPGQAAPQIALPSRPGAPNTITCLHGEIPEGY